MDVVNNTTRDLEKLKNDVIDWTSANGLLVRNKDGGFTNCPIAVIPTPFPKGVYAEACAVATTFNRLVDRVSRDIPWLLAQLESTAAGDDFIMQQIQICKKLNYEEQGQQNMWKKQKLYLGLNRSDYMIHEPPESERGVSIISSIENQGGILQVELNTIASSFGALSDKTCDLHRFLLSRYQKSSAKCYHSIGNNTIQKIDPECLPVTTNIKILSQAMAEAFKLYTLKGVNSEVIAKKYILFIVQENETNTVDQRMLEYELFNNHNIHVLRRSLTNLSKTAEIVVINNTPIMYIDDKSKEISVVYFRDGYSPDAYPTKAEWEVRELIEKSYAIKCPSIAYQLVGAKKIQQTLSKKGVLERYLSKDDAVKIRRCFAGLYEVNSDTISVAMKYPEHFVLKPQREGGGNNFYGKDIPVQLQKMSEVERGAYILMQRIFPPPQNALLLTKNGDVKATKTLSELGIYGAFLGDGTTEYYNKKAGHLLRTKIEGTDEGGVASGYAVLDSPYLI
jgi:glutathione synthase